MNFLIRKGFDWDSARLGRPREVPIEVLLDRGIVLLDKEDGPTSHDVAATVKRMFEGTVVFKVGHGGTLDPAATGILPLLLNKAALVQDVILSSRKEYVGIMHLHGDVPEANVESMVKTFTGPIFQRPPDRSAVARVVRIRQIEQIDILEQVGRDVLLRVACEAGTYVRKLCVDIGEAIGCGAHLTELRRTRSGCFSESQGLVTLGEIGLAVAAWLDDGDETSLRRIVHPVERVFDCHPAIVVGARGSGGPLPRAIDTGTVIAASDSIENGTEVAVFDENGFILARATAAMPAAALIEAPGTVAAKIIKLYAGIGNLV